MVVSEMQCHMLEGISDHKVKKIYQLLHQYETKLEASQCDINCIVLWGWYLPFTSALRQTRLNPNIFRPTEQTSWNRFRRKQSRRFFYYHEAVKNTSRATISTGSVRVCYWQPTADIIWMHVLASGQWRVFFVGGETRVHFKSFTATQWHTKLEKCWIIRVKGHLQLYIWRTSVL